MISVPNVAVTASRTSTIYLPLAILPFCTVEPVLLTSVSKPKQDVQHEHGIGRAVVDRNHVGQAKE
jgi:hypothetical protein